MNDPIVQTYGRVWVVRDDLHPGGTKARFIGQVFAGGVQEAVYASPPEGGAQMALATVARALGKRATIFTAKRAKPHARTIEAARLGAKIVAVTPGYLGVVQARAREYCATSGAYLIPFGAEIAGGVEAIAAAARATGLDPDEVWCAGGSGVLARGLARAWPDARRHVVQIGRTLTSAEVAGAEIHVHPLRYEQAAQPGAPFPSDRHYDAKAWEVCAARHGPGRVLFWNVAPLPITTGRPALQERAST